MKNRPKFSVVEAVCGGRQAAQKLDAGGRQPAPQSDRTGEQKQRQLSHRLTVPDGVDRGSSRPVARTARPRATPGPRGMLGA